MTLQHPPVPVSQPSAHGFLPTLATGLRKTAPTQIKETGKVYPVSSCVRRACAVERQQVFNKRAFLNILTMPPTPVLAKCSTTLFNNCLKGLLDHLPHWRLHLLLGFSGGSLKRSTPHFRT